MSEHDKPDPGETDPTMADRPEGDAPDPAAAPHEQPTFAVVGIGASAGGLDALEQFFASVPPDPGMAFVVVTHTQAAPAQPAAADPRPPDRDAGGRGRDATPLEPDHVYVSPGGRLLTIDDDVLQPHDPAPTTAPPAADRLLLPRARRPTAARARSASSCRAPARTGPSGSRRSRPPAAWRWPRRRRRRATRACPTAPPPPTLVDYVLPPGADAGAAGRVRPRRRPARRPGADRRHAPTDLEDLQRIFALLRRHAGHDFSAYKPTTMRRRIERRMNVHHLATPHDYLDLLQSPARRARRPVPRAPHQRDLVLPRPGRVRRARAGPGRSDRRARRPATRSGPGCRAARPARRPTRSRSCSGSASIGRAGTTWSRSSPPTSTPRRSTSPGPGSIPRASPPT